MPKYGIFSGPYFPHLDWILRISPYSVRMRKNTDQKKTPYLDTFQAVDIIRIQTTKPMDLDFDLRNLSPSLLSSEFHN